MATITSKDRLVLNLLKAEKQGLQPTTIIRRLDGQVSKRSVFRILEKFDNSKYNGLIEKIDYGTIKMYKINPNEKEGIRPRMVKCYKCGEINVFVANQKTKRCFKCGRRIEATLKRQARTAEYLLEKYDKKALNFFG